MARDRTDKRHALQQDGTLRPARTRVRAGLFWQHPTFFDPRDELQVKYEMLRAHFVDGQAVTAACAAFGYSRQTFHISGCGPTGHDSGSASAATTYAA